MRKRNNWSRIIAGTIGTLLLLVIFMMACMGSVKVEASTIGTIYITGTQDYQEANAVLKAINKERNKRGLSSVRIDKNLTNSAIQRAAELAIYIPATSPHKRPNGKRGSSVNSRIKYEICSESYGYYDAEDIVSGWMGSSIHRKGILLRNAKSVGISCFIIGNTTNWCVEFSSSGARSNVPNNTSVTVTKKVSALNKYIGSARFELKKIKNMYAGQEETIYVKFKGNTKYNRQFPAVMTNAKSWKWSSDNTSIASVSKNGVITAKKAGTVTISAKLKKGPKVKKSIKIIVSEQ